MKFAFLPNYFKKIGIACFFAAFAIIIVVSVMATLDMMATISQSDSIASSFELGYNMGTELASSYYWVLQISSILLLLSMAFYMLAKEKVDDEYMDAMRWESLKLATLICIAITIVCIILNIKLMAKTLLFIQFISYLITFKVKKSNA